MLLIQGLDNVTLREIFNFICHIEVKVWLLKSANWSSWRKYVPVFQEEITRYMIGLFCVTQ